LKDLDFVARLAVKASDGDALRTDLNDRSALALIPPKSNRATDIPCDTEMYNGAIWSGTSFAESKNSAASPPDTSFSAMIHLVGSVLATR
jgi:hypothetical protein